MNKIFMDNQIQYLERAISLAKQHSRSGVNGPFAAVIVKDDVIIAEGWNQVIKNCDPSAHAEVVAIRKACQHLKSHSLKGCILYSSCEPCPMCLSACIWARLDKVIFSEDRYGAAKAGFDDEVIYQAINQSGNKKSYAGIIQCEQHLLQSATDVFNAWKNNKDRKEY